MEDQFVCQRIDHVIGVCAKLLDIELLDALVTLELGSGVLLVAHLAHHLHFGAVHLDVVIELGSGHVLELFKVADITTELWAGELGMSLELAKGFPDDLRSSILDMASMWELTEVNTVSEDLVNLL